MSDLTIDYDVHLDFQPLLTRERGELLRDLVDTAQELANLSMRIGFLRAEEVRDPRGPAKSERVEAECLRAAYEEKKWVVIRLLDIGTGDSAK